MRILDRAIAGAVLAICLANLLVTSTNAQTKRRAPAGKRPAPAPIDVPLLKPLDYSRVIQKTPNRVVIVNFWATWCGPCVAEMPELIRLEAAFRERGVRFVGISADEVGDLKREVIPFLRAKKVVYENYIQATNDPQEMIDAVNKEWDGTLPATFLYDRKGRLAFFRLGIINRDTLTREIEKALKQ